MPPHIFKRTAQIRNFLPVFKVMTTENRPHKSTFMTFLLSETVLKPLTLTVMELTEIQGVRLVGNDKLGLICDKVAMTRHCFRPVGCQMPGSPASMKRRVSSFLSTVEAETSESDKRIITRYRRRRKRLKSSVLPNNCAIMTPVKQGTPTTTSGQTMRTVIV